MPPRKFWKTDPLRCNLRAFQGHSHACYNSYCVCGSGICMRIDLMLLYLLYVSLDHDYHEEEKLGKIAVNLITIFFRGHPGLAEYRTVWATFSRYFLLDAFSLVCAIQIVSAHQCHSRFLANHLNSLIVERTGFMLTESTSFPRTILPIYIYEYHFCWVLN